MKKWILAKTRSQPSSTTGLLGVTTVGMVDTLGICLAGSGKLFKSSVFHLCMLHQVGHDSLVLSTIKMFYFRTLAELTMLLSFL